MNQNNNRPPKKNKQAASGGPNKNRNRNNRNRKPSGGNNRNRSNRNKYASKLTSVNSIFTKYDNLLENYLRLRTKYFEYFYKDRSKQRTKVCDNYNKALEQLQNFTKQLSEYQLEKFRSRGFFKLDHTYSANHDIDPELTSVELSDKPNDPHYTQLQQEQESFKNDIEESSGSIEDYNSYKGL